jgi:copper(I)-binding protein
MSIARTTRLGVLAIVALAALTACNSTEPPQPSGPSAGLEITDAWIKTASSGMTAAFAEITNTSNADITIVSATSAASPELQLHEVVNDTMRQKESGFVVPAGSSITLEPGGLHIMFMDIQAPVAAGDEVPVTLTLANGNTVQFTAVAKDYTGANENYDDGSMDMDMSTPTPSS